MKNKYLFLVLSILVGLCGGCELKPKNQPIEPTVTLNPKPTIPSSEPSTSLRLVLRYKNNNIEIGSALPRRSVVTEPIIDRGNLLEGKSILLEYRGLDDTKEVLAQDLIVIPLTARVEFQDPEIPNNLQRFEETLTDPWVQVSIPYDENITFLEFSRLQPEPITDEPQWERIRLNSILLPINPEAPK